MSLGPGTRLGVYEIVGLIGAGGMGEVYRAHDARLGRDVAIKVLPSAFSGDAERLHRFEQEARAAAALNHPNILAVYDIGYERLRPARGAGGERGDAAPPNASERGWGPASRGEASPYIVSELLEGETLGERAHGVALPVRKAVDCAVQIAHGLAAAHEKGIVHRDLKPANIFITTDGRVKILDFGLAKLTEREPAVGGMPGPQDPAYVPTKLPDTLPGMVLGTVGYMSPEQVRGRTADHRADIFAFGAILYELLSGQRAFAGNTVVDTMTAILKEDPPDLPTTAQHIPAALARIVDRCLEKSPAARFQSAGDLGFALEGLSAQSETAAGALVDGRKGLLSNAPLAWTVAAVLVVATIAAAALGTMEYLRRPPADTRVYRASILPPVTLTAVVTVNEPARAFALSPDGQHLAFIGTGQDGKKLLWVRRLDGLDARPFAGTDDAIAPFWSPDSRWVGFAAGGMLKKVDLLGGAPVTISDAAGFVGSATWNRDGVILFGKTLSGIQRVSASGGTPASATTRDVQAGQGGHAYPFFLPDGRHFVYYTVGRIGESGLWVGSLDSNERKLVLRNESNAIYADGHLLFVRGSTLMAQPFDVQRLELEGEAMPVADQVPVGRRQLVNGPGGAFSASESGAVAYVSGSIVSQLTWLDHSGKKLGVVGEPENTTLGPVDPALSPDGRRVAVARWGPTGRDLWVIEMARSVTTRFTFDAADDSDPIWSLDNSAIVFRSNRSGGGDLYRKSASGAGSDELLLGSPSNKVPLDWSPDGRFLLFMDTDPRTERDLWVLPMTGDRKPTAFVNTSFSEANGQFSPDGRWVVYQSNESGRNEVYVRPFAAASGAQSGQWQVSTNGGIMPRWRRDGRELYYVAGDAKLMAAPVQASGTAFEAGTPVPLFQTQIVGGPTATSRTVYVAAADGRFLIFNATSDQPTPPITLIVNWTASLKK